ncbi:competence protein CoiA family protein [Pseudomonas xionganensis]|uniref:Competence protein n=1 Tax=Pseudomonas xionganensis TaxID=2654845 RepID=A0A6I4KWV4_9PSED|nr:competence protein CoiA family protein [Pseudomonas xionganensis]MVW77200.1 hypothetical protein [Pseudomonas xionganensis]
MTMTIAIDDQARIVSIGEVARGLVCGCRCIECAEPVVARKGPQRVHHFSHVSQKQPCEVMPESFLHRYAKQVVEESLGLQLPPQPGHHPDSDDQSSWWDFDSVEQEVWLGSFRPDLVAELPDGPLLLEFACTSFVDDEKQALIEQLGIRAVEVNLSGLLVTPTAVGLQELRRAILHDVSLKQWLYPPASAPSMGEATPLSVEVAVETEPRNQMPEPLRFSIQGLWVDLRVLEFGSVVVRSVAYSPAIAGLLKRLARQYSGRYVAKFRNWMFPAWAETFVRQELEALADHDQHSPAHVSAAFSALSAATQIDLGSYLDAREIHRQYLSGLAPECLPWGEFGARHFGTGLDCDALEDLLKSSGVEILGVEIIRVKGQMDFAYRLRR